jgi:NADH-quinone oxidoreductase subunit L
MIAPLVVLAVLCVVGGWVGPPMIEGGNPFHRWLAPVFETTMVRAGADDPAAPPAAAVAGAESASTPRFALAQHGHAEQGAGEAHDEGAGHGGDHALERNTEILLMVLSVVVALAGIYAAWRLYLKQPGLATALRERWSGLHRTLFNKYWVDEYYDALVVRPIHRAARAMWTFFDVRVVDGAVNGVGHTFEGFSAVFRLFQTGFVGTYAFFFALGVAFLLLHFLR